MFLKGPNMYPSDHPSQINLKSLKNGIQKKQEKGKLGGQKKLNPIKTRDKNKAAPIWSFDCSTMLDYKPLTADLKAWMDKISIKEQSPLSSIPNQKLSNEKGHANP